MIIQRIVRRRSPGPARGAFSLLELLAVVTILGIIAVIVIPRIVASSTATKENACFRNKNEINRAIETYYFENGSWPADITAVGAMSSFPDGVPVCPVTNVAYALDGTTHRISGHNAGSH